MSNSQQTRGDDCSRAFLDVCMETISARQGTFGAPRVLEAEGLRQIVVTELPPYRLLLNSDGVGTKVEVAERVGRYDTLGRDLVAMLVDDAVRFGAEPLSMSNVLDLSQADTEVADALARGLGEAARIAEISVVSGEVAELGSRVRGWGDGAGSNWAGTLLSVLRPERALTGATIESGHSVVAVREPGLRSNGFTLARRILGEKFGEHWHDEVGPEGPWGESLLQPSVIYAPALLDLLGRYETRGRVPVSGIVHVTGGGVPGKLARQLAGRGLGAQLDDLFGPSAFLSELIRLGEIDDETAYQTWCMGQGALVLTPEPEALIKRLGRRDLEARVAGSIIAGDEIRLRSRGPGNPGQTLSFPIVHRR